MTKSEFVDQIAAESDLPKGQAQRVVDAMITVIEDTLKRGGEVNFTGFGKFTVTQQSSRDGVNPQTGERLKIASRRVPRFTAGSSLKKAVN